MAWCLTAPSHYLIQCWCVTSKVPWHSSEGIIMRKDLKIPISETRLKISLLRWHADPPGASELMIGCQVSRLINGHQSGMLYSIIIIWPYEKKRVTYSSIDCDLAEQDWIIYSVKTSVILTYIAANHDYVICNLLHNFTNCWIKNSLALRQLLTVACYWEILIWIWPWLVIFRANSRFAPSQWETALLGNDVSLWLGARKPRISPDIGYASS